MKRVYMILLGLLAAQVLAVPGEADSSLVVEDEEVLKEALHRAAAAQSDVEMLAWQDIHDTIIDFLGQFDPLWLPYVPTLVSFGNISMALTEVSILGLGGVIPSFKLLREEVTLLFPTLTLYCGHYISGGRLLSVPVVGESTANITLENFNVTVSVSVVPLEGTLCAEPNTTAVTLTVDQAFVHFADLNPGRGELGYLVNVMLESVVPDILKLLSEELSPGGSLQEKLDPIVVGLINGITGCSSEEEEPRMPVDLPEIDVRGENVIGVLQILGDYLGRVFESVSLEEIFSSQLADFMASGVKQMGNQESVNLY